MLCKVCGHETENTNQYCSNCSHLDQVQVLSPEEREGFHGMTIEQEGQVKKNVNSKSPFPGVFIFNSITAGPFTKLILSAVLLILVIMFLPLAILIAITWGLTRLIRT